MKIYLVGGAVRDKLLKLKVHDRDFCVTGATEEDMLKKGFTQCGKEFPVYLHPQTHEEYAMARKERKNGHGYNGFVCDFSPDVTIEEDLIRRDLTINAIAQDENGNLIDPSNGIKDLNNRILRHVSDAFIEDPLRVLRLARFYARFYKFGFSVAPETINLCNKIVLSGELNHLTAERVWLETKKALATDNPEIYFTFLKDINALNIILPEFAKLTTIPEDLNTHPEGNVFAHTMLTLKQIVKLTTYLPMRFAMLCHDLGKISTQNNDLPHHPKHRTKGKEHIKALCNRLQIPNEYMDLAIRISSAHSYVNLTTKKPEKILELISLMDAYRKPHNIAFLAQALYADFYGRAITPPKNFYAPYYIEYLFAQSLKVNVKKIIEEGFKGKDISTETAKRRIDAIAKAQKDLIELYSKLDTVRFYK